MPRPLPAMPLRMAAMSISQMPNLTFRQRVAARRGVAFVRREVALRLANDEAPRVHV